MLKTKMKASKVANLTDARYFAAWEVDWLGFCLDPASDAYVDPKKMQAMRGWLAGPKIVGEFGVATVESIREAYELLDLDMVQVGPFQGANVLGLLDGIPLIKEMIIEPSSEDVEVQAACKDADPYVKFFILDFAANGISWEAIQAGNTFRLSILKDICRQHNTLIKMDLTGKEALALLEEVKPYGLSVIGGSEEKVGFKSFDELDDIFEALEVQL